MGIEDPTVKSAILWPTKPRFKYLKSYSDTSNATIYTFSDVYLGQPNPKLMTVFGVTCEGSNAVSSIVINGSLSATLAITSGSNARSAELWYALTGNVAFGSVVVTFSGAATAAILHVWQGYPSRITPIDAVGDQGASSPRTITDLAKTQGGFTCFCAKNNSAATAVITGTGPESINNYFDATLESAAVSAHGFDNTVSSTADDYTATFSVSTGCGVAGATWR